MASSSWSVAYSLLKPYFQYPTKALNCRLAFQDPFHLDASMRNLFGTKHERELGCLSFPESRVFGIRVLLTLLGAGLRELMQCCFAAD